MESGQLIEAHNITFEIDSRKLLDDVSLDVNAGEIVAGVGPNGAGKSTLRKILSGDWKPSAGEVTFNQKLLSHWPVAELARMRAVLPQDSSLNFPLTVFEVVLMGRAPHVNTVETKHDLAIAREALEAVGALHLENRLYPTLSGGERQRVHLARVLAQIWEADGDATRYLLLDEPTANLDLTHQHQTMKIARGFARQGVGVFVIVHDLNLASQYADRVLILNEGKMVAFGAPHEVLTESIIREAFGVDVGVMDHPFFDCPLVVWRDDPGEIHLPDQ